MGRLSPRLAVILVGGRSSRFGKDKVLETINGITLIEILIHKLQNLKFEIFLSGSLEKYGHFGFPVIEDKEPYAGPLCALESIWKKIKGNRILLLAADMPFITEKTIEDLWQKSLKKDITLLKDQQGPSPLPAVYSRKTENFIKKIIREGKRDLKSLWETGLRRGTINSEEKSLININTEEDLRQCRE